MLVLEDDGCGLPPGSSAQGFGLTGMRERVTALGGTLTISAPTVHGCASIYRCVTPERIADVRLFKSPAGRRAD